MRFLLSMGHRLQDIIVELRVPDLQNVKDRRQMLHNEYLHSAISAD